MTVFSPADFAEAQQMTLEAVKINGPVYLRLSRLPVPAMKLPYSDYGNNNEVGIIATGHLVHQAQQASFELEQEGISTRVLNLSVIKPLNEKMILALAQQSIALVTVEDHQLAGGMGSAVAEFLAQNYPIKISFVAVKDQFGQSGKPEELLRHYGLDTKAIKETVYKIIKN